MAMGKSKKVKHRGPVADYSDVTGGGKTLANAIGDMPQARAAREFWLRSRRNAPRWSVPARMFW